MEYRSSASRASLTGAQRLWDTRNKNAHLCIYSISSLSICDTVRRWWREGWGAHVFLNGICFRGVVILCLCSVTVPTSKTNCTSSQKVYIHGKHTTWFMAHTTWLMAHTTGFSVASRYPSFHLTSWPCVGINVSQNYSLFLFSGLH